MLADKLYDRIDTTARVSGMEFLPQLINFGIFAATAIAAIIAWRGVRDAQQARDEAAGHEAAASAAAGLAASAQVRIADVLEQSAAGPPPLWEIDPLGDNRWRIINVSNLIFTSVDIIPEARSWRTSIEPPRRLAPGESFRLEILEPLEFRPFTLELFWFTSGLQHPQSLTFHLTSE